MSMARGGRRRCWRRALGLKLHAEDWRNKADVLRRRFDEVFFDEEMGLYVLALDGEKKPCRVRASNAGHALFTGIAFEERAGAVVGALMDRTFFSGWGVRTLASTEAALQSDELSQRFGLAA